MKRKAPPDIARIPDVVLTHGTQTIRLSPDDLVLLLSRMVREGQLYVCSIDGDWCYGSTEVLVESDDHGHIYLTPCDGSVRPEYRLPGYVVRDGQRTDD